MRRVMTISTFPFLALALFGQASRILVHEAQEDLRAGRYAQAEEELSRALAAESSNWNLWCNLGAARIELGKNDPAISAFEHAHRLSPQQASPYFGLGLAYMKKGDAGKALEAYGRGLGKMPNDLAANQNYALLLIQQGDFRHAIAPLKRLENLQPADVSTRATLIEAYAKTGMKNEVAEETGKLLSANLANMQGELSLARLLLGNGEGMAAVKVLQHAVAAWPDAAESHGELGLLLIEGQQYEGAVEELGRAAQLNPDSARYGLGLGEALLRWRHDPVALKYLLAVRPKFGNIPLCKFELALAYFNLTQFPMAQHEFENLAREQPNSSRVQYLLGGTYQAMGKLDKAEECFRKAIALKPDEASYYVTLATLLKKVKPADLAEPVRLTERALALSPENQEAKLLLASCNQAQGKLAEAQALLEDVVTHDPELRAAHVALAQVYFREKKMEDAQRQESIAAKLEEREQNAVSPWGPGGVAKP